VLSDEEKKIYNLTTRATVINLFITEIYGYSKKARVFVPDRPFQTSIMCSGLTRRLKGTSLRYVTNIRLF
jgi:hypothetical protein